MNNKKKSIPALSFLAIASVVGFVLSTPRHNSICRRDDLFCSEVVGEIIGMPLFLFSMIIFVLLLFLYFFHIRLPNSWKTFSAIYVAISVILIVLSPSTARNFLGFEREWVTWLLAIIFFIVSIILITITSIREKTEK